MSNSEKRKALELLDNLRFDKYPLPEERQINVGNREVRRLDGIEKASGLANYTMDVQVLDYISQIKRGELVKAAKTSFDCIQCGLCASRCFGEIPQYHAAQLARRLQGGKLAPRAEHLAKIVKQITDGEYDDMIASLQGMDEAKLKEVYTNREMEPPMADESWQPSNREGLVG